MDEIIQRTIHEQFRNCTVLTVAHRLRTVINSDRILVLKSITFVFLYVSFFLKVLENGKVLEFNSPRVLLSDPTSHLSSLVKQAGTAEVEYLRMMANSITDNNESERA
jgi:ATP-binding cassette subfamily C (CFTR/MRP) protein 4